MVREAVDSLALPPSGKVVDCTFGRGGHSRAILDRLGSEGRVLALDKDPAAIASPEAEQLAKEHRFTLVHASFAQLKAIAEERGWLGEVAGVLMDLGVSSPQLDDAERGFSFTRDGPLDMRMDPRQGMTAAEWLATVPEHTLAQVLRDYGEERYARRIARALVARRSSQPFTRTGDLAQAIARSVPTREPGKHPATRSFQAIRIYLNRELEELQAGLQQAVEVLRPGGRLVVIAFHSLEDRIVKRFLRDQARGGPAAPRLPVQEARPARLRPIGKPRTPGAVELAANPRARSAVLRVAERTFAP
ncbi:16S rRNA m(4)C1402 methyltransferase [Candidatus Methylocalor cossyra]|uniref:Ribosomal RNA small subunit methyltransferase H n=2 Tax=Candidatus Methylocalor cossyra TaxID=3108543 RepID=A0ABM9NHX7_9GAMM